MAVSVFDRFACGSFDSSRLDSGRPRMEGVVSNLSRVSLMSGGCQNSVVESAQVRSVVRVPFQDGDEVVDLFLRIRLRSSIGFWLCRAVNMGGRLFITINALPFC